LRKCPARSDKSCRRLRAPQAADSSLFPVAFALTATGGVTRRVSIVLTDTASSAAAVRTYGSLPLPLCVGWCWSVLRSVSCREVGDWCAIPAASDQCRLRVRAHQAFRNRHDNRLWVGLAAGGVGSLNLGCRSPDVPQTCCSNCTMRAKAMTGSATRRPTGVAMAGFVSHGRQSFSRKRQAAVLCGTSP
jgi:hypothetical protein